MRNGFSNPQEYVHILQNLLRNDKNSSISYKKSKIQYLLNFRWWNPFTWKFYIHFKKMKKNNGC